MTKEATHDSGAQDEWTVAEGTDLDEFRVLRPLGRGGVGEVYLALDTRLGRKVALKVLYDEDHASHGPRLLDEARLGAALNHPSIVTVYGVGTDGGRHYVAMEFLSGDTLDYRFARETPSLLQVARWGAKIAWALAHAHKHGVVHGDLKPQNVVLAGDGRLRIVDFGLGRSLGPEPPVVNDGYPEGTPGYLPPEAWRGHAPAPPRDVWALGALLYELLEGELPYTPADLFEHRWPGPPRFERSRPGQLGAFVLEALKFDASARPSAEQLAQWIETFIDPTANDDLSPFPGLSAFDADRTRHFFGRTEEVAAFLERLRAETSVAIIGHSGAGKSSFVRAGVIPRLEELGVWRSLVLRPGPRPFDALARALIEAGIDSAPAQLAQELREEPDRLPLHLDTLARSAGARVLLAVDQLEELFTNVDAPPTQEGFLRALTAVAEDAEARHRLVMTVRDDFVSQFPRIRGVFVLRPLARAALKEAIEAPLRQRGYRFESPARLDEIVSDLESQPARLALLQVILLELWGHRDTERQELSEESCRAIGGAAGALGLHADRVLALFSGEDQRTVKALFLRLVTPDGLRRPIASSELANQLGDHAVALAERLVGARLLSARAEGEQEDETYFELAHEALIDSWRRLRGWIEGSREELRALDEVRRAAEIWDERGRPAQEVWSGDQVRMVKQRLGRAATQLPKPARAFLEIGLEQHRRQRTRRRRIAGLVAGGLLAVTAGSLGLAAEFRRREQQLLVQRDQINLASADAGHARLDVRADAPSSEGLGVVKVHLHMPDPGRLYRPGRPLPLIRTHEESIPLGIRVTIEARSGPAVMVVERGPCPPSVVPIASLPGYAERGFGPRAYDVRVPSCAESLESAVLVPAGPFLYGGPGPARAGPPEVSRGEQRIHLEAFRIDRFEVSNARYSAFTRNATVTGILPPVYPKLDALSAAGRPSHPVTGVNAIDADAFCAFHGGALPTNQQWTKAARGPLGNSEQSRRHLSYPWGPTFRRELVNLAGEGDTFEQSAPVHAFAGNASPFGVVNLIGNVYEWTASVDEQQGLRIIRGAGFGSEVAWGHQTTSYENLRDPRFFDYGTGFRCAYPP